MDRSVWLRRGTTAVLPLVMALAGGVVHAQSNDDEDKSSLKLSTALRDRTFMRLGAVAVNVKTKSGNTYDVTGPVINKGDLRKAGVPLTGASNTPNGQLRSGLNLAGDALDDALTTLNWSGLGTPDGIKARADDSMATPAISIGYYLTDDYTWVVEAFVLAAPLKSKIYGEGINSMLQPNGIAGKHILDTKLLPPTVLLGRYWGDRSAKFRPYTGLMATYAIFFDTKATTELNDYVGGGSPGDTSVSLKNAFGVGPSVGFKYQIDEQWHASFNVGSVKLKTQATLVTRNTQIKTGAAVLADYPSEVLKAIDTANALSSGNPVFSASNGGAITVLMRAVSRDRGFSNGDLGTYERKQDTTLTNTLLMLSVGRSF